MLYGVDDGAKTIDESVGMLKIAHEQGIEAVILTPHLRHGMFSHPLDKIEEHYKKLKPYADECGIDLRLGTEYHVASDIVESFKSGRCHTLADSQYILTEYSSVSEFSFMLNMTKEVIFAGYIPVIAHVERYGCLVDDPDNVEELRGMGAFIQVNADAVLGIDGRGAKKYTRLLLKHGLVDFIASDSHGTKTRACNMKKCYDVVSKKYGKDYADKIMEINPSKIINKRN